MSDIKTNLSNTDNKFRVHELSVGKMSSLTRKAGNVREKLFVNNIICTLEANEKLAIDRLIAQLEQAVEDLPEHTEEFSHPVNDSTSDSTALPNLYIPSQPFLPPAPAELQSFDNNYEYKLDNLLLDDSCLGSGSLEVKSQAAPADQSFAAVLQKYPFSDMAVGDNQHVPSADIDINQLVQSSFPMTDMDFPVGSDKTGAIDGADAVSNDEIYSSRMIDVPLPVGESMKKECLKRKDNLTSLPPAKSIRMAC